MQVHAPAPALMSLSSSRLDMSPESSDLLVPCSPRAGGRLALSAPARQRLARAWARYDLGNALLLLLLLAAGIALQFVPPRRRHIVSFEDASINYPLLAQTVSGAWLGFCCVLLPLGVLGVVFYVRRRRPHARKELYVVMIGFLYAMLLTFLCTELLKRAAGRPRPNFVQMAKYLADGSFGATEFEIQQSMQSFPSGHASLSFAGLGYLSLYLFALAHPRQQRGAPFDPAHYRAQGWKTLGCLLPLMLAAWIGVTRITDGWHNQDDVAIGALLGLALASLTFRLHVRLWWRAVAVEERGIRAAREQAAETEFSESASSRKN